MESLGTLFVVELTEVSIPAETVTATIRLTLLGKGHLLLNSRTEIKYTIMSLISNVYQGRELLQVQSTSARPR